MDPDVLLKAENVVRTFGAVRAVDGLNLEVRAGEMVACAVMHRTDKDHFVGMPGVERQNVGDENARDVGGDGAKFAAII